MRYRSRTTATTSHSGIAIASSATCLANPLPQAWSVAAIATATKSPVISQRRRRSSRTLGPRGAAAAPASVSTLRPDEERRGERDVRLDRCQRCDGGGGGLRSGAHRDDQHINAPGAPPSCKRPPGEIRTGRRYATRAAGSAMRIPSPRPSSGSRMRAVTSARECVSSLRERRRQVRLDRALGEVQLVGDLAVREPAHHEPQDLLLAVRQRLAHDVLAQRARDDDLAGVDRRAPSAQGTRRPARRRRRRRRPPEAGGAARRSGGRRATGSPRARPGA